MTRILIVDDDESFREDIAAALRHSGYETICASDGQEALQVTRTSCPDLILLDIAMPVMDGFSCLREFRADPAMRDIPVIILSALSEREAIVRAAQFGVASYMLKSSFSMPSLLEMVAKFARKSDRPQSATPCHRPMSEPPARLVALSSDSPPPLAGSVRSSVVKRAKEKLRLSSVPPVLHYVLQLTNSKTSGLDDLVHMIRQDQALALRVMKLANSSFYRAPRRAQNLTEAAQRLGLSGIRNAVTAIMAIEHFSQESAAGLVPQWFWEHALATALLAQLIGEAVHVKEPEQLFLAGLFHDMGRMVLGSLHPQEYQDILTAAESRGVDLSVLEQKVFGLNHAEVTREVLVEWNLPSAVIEAAAAHESDPARIHHSADEPRAAQIVALANRLAHALLLGHSGNALLLPIDPLPGELGLDHDKLMTIAHTACERTREAELFFASQGECTFRASFASELVRDVGAPPRVTILSPDRSCHGLWYFLDQLHWRDDTSPETAVLSGAGEEDLQWSMNALQQIEARLGRTLGLLIVSPGEVVAPLSDLVNEHPWTALSLPCRYTRVIECLQELAGRDKDTAPPSCSLA